MMDRYSYRVLRTERSTHGREWTIAYHASVRSLHHHIEAKKCHRQKRCENKYGNDLFIKRFHIGYSFARFKSTAFNATMTVETDIKAAANAGCRMIPLYANTPAAKGKAITLYPVAQKRFWIILR